MGNTMSDIPSPKMNWTYRAKNQYRDTVPVVSGDGSTVALYSRGERKLIVLNSQGSTLSTIPLKQKMLMANVSAIPSLSHDGSKIVTRDAHSVCCYNKSGTLLWEYERKDKVVRSGMQSWIAQISRNGAVVVVRQFKELIFLDGNTGHVITVFQTRRQMATNIPRISDDGSTVVVCDDTDLLGFVNGRHAWTAASPVKRNGFRGSWWGDPALSGDGNTSAVVGKNTVYLFHAKTGESVAQIHGVVHRHQELKGSVSLSQDGTRCAVTLDQGGIAVYSGKGFSSLLLSFRNKGLGFQPAAPLLTRNGTAVAAKCHDSILVWELDTATRNPARSPDLPTSVVRVHDISTIPGGRTVHTRNYHHDRDTHHKRTFACSDDGSLCVAVAKCKELWAFSLTQKSLLQGSVLPAPHQQQQQQAPHHMVPMATYATEKTEA